MKRKVISLIILSCFFSLFNIQAQLTYHDATRFKLLGKASDETETRYERLPYYLKEVSRKPVWDLGKNTAGLAIRFSTNAQTIGARWTLSQDVSMNHMTVTGIKGLDLYCLENGEWTFVNSARPKLKGKENETVIVNNMTKEDREFILFLPLYDGLTSLEIGVDSLAKIDLPQINLPQAEKPIVAYGTSILQGGCASRPGMAHTNILSRWLNREIINLGFSGNGQLDYEIAELMAKVDASIFILDFMPNVTADQVYEKMEKFYSILREKHPATPILFVENPIFPKATYDQEMKKAIIRKNEALHRVFSKINKEDKNLSILPSSTMIGTDKEATVDGTHFTDLGFMRYAEYLYPTLKKLLE